MEQQESRWISSKSGIMGQVKAAIDI